LKKTKKKFNSAESELPKEAFKNDGDTVNGDETIDFYGRNSGGKKISHTKTQKNFSKTFFLKCNNRSQTRKTKGRTEKGREKKMFFFLLSKTILIFSASLSIDKK
jgi:hypothetical protein